MIWGHIDNTVQHFQRTRYIQGPRQRAGIGDKSAPLKGGLVACSSSLSKSSRLHTSNEEKIKRHKHKKKHANQHWERTHIQSLGGNPTSIVLSLHLRLAFTLPIFSRHTWNHLATSSSVLSSISPSLFSYRAFVSLCTVSTVTPSLGSTAL